jgi:predicted RNase H-like nuclease (RuvC/YqgF family)
MKNENDICANCGKKRSQHVAAPSSLSSLETHEWCPKGKGEFDPAADKSNPSGGLDNFVEAIRQRDEALGQLATDLGQRIEELTRERDDLRIKVDGIVEQYRNYDTEIRKEHTAATARIEVLQAERDCYINKSNNFLKRIQELEKDGERMDWLEKCINSGMRFTWNPKEGTPFRTAIDSAMDKGTK